MQVTIPSADHPKKEKNLPRITLGLTWLIVLPAAGWEIATYYLPLLGGNLNQIGTWVITLVILLLSGISLVCHVLAHHWVSRRFSQDSPAGIPLLAFGDAAQHWPPAASIGRELLAAAAGPVCNLIIAGLAYLAWTKLAVNALNLIALFISGFNTWLFLISLLPVYPMDGGRLVSALLRGTMHKPGSESRLMRTSGFVLAALLAGWGIFLIAQNSRFSWPTGLITFLLVLLIVDGARFLPAEVGEGRTTAVSGRGQHLRRWIGAVLVGLVLLTATASLLLVNNGLDAPGLALPIDPMVQVPASYRHAHVGQFFLVTVVSQAPITAGEWLVGQVDPAIQIVPPEAVTPKNTTPERQARQNIQMLDNSETIAIAVGLRLAGYSTVLMGKGVQVDAILPGSHASGLLQVNDVITAMNGSKVETAGDLVNLVSAQATQSPVRLQVRRGQAVMQVDVPLLPPASLGSGPRIGIEIQTAGFDYQPPFPVSIVTDKIAGGPSAGLMFTLSVYNALSPTDLTSGRKIAGTGTINLDGSVGPIGGVKQKVFAAEAVGASYFLCPADNYRDAVSVARNIKVVEVANVDQAISFLRSLPAQ